MSQLFSNWNNADNSSSLLTKRAKIGCETGSVISAAQPSMSKSTTSGLFRPVIVDSATKVPLELTEQSKKPEKVAPYKTMTFEEHYAKAQTLFANIGAK